jgi:hypothetical protein
MTGDERTLFRCETRVRRREVRPDVVKMKGEVVVE